MNSQRVARRLGMTEGRRVQFHGYEHCVFELASAAKRVERALRVTTATGRSASSTPASAASRCCARSVALPAEDLIYLADSAYTPYGDRPAAVITERSIAMVTAARARRRQGGRRGLQYGDRDRGRCAARPVQLPIVAIEPAVKPRRSHAIGRGRRAGDDADAGQRAVLEAGGDACGGRSRGDAAVAGSGRARRGGGAVHRGDASLVEQIRQAAPRQRRRHDRPRMHALSVSQRGHSGCGRAERHGDRSSRRRCARAAPPPRGRRSAGS